MLQDALRPCSETLPVCTTGKHSPLGIRDSHLPQMKPHPFGSSDHPAIQESIPKQDMIYWSIGHSRNALGQRDILAEPCHSPSTMGAQLLSEGGLISAALAAIVLSSLSP